MRGGKRSHRTGIHFQVVPSCRTDTTLPLPRRVPLRLDNPFSSFRPSWACPVRCGQANVLWEFAPCWHRFNSEPSLGGGGIMTAQPASHRGAAPSHSGSARSGRAARLWEDGFRLFMGLDVDSIFSLLWSSLGNEEIGWESRRKSAVRSTITSWVEGHWVRQGPAGQFPSASRATPGPGRGARWFRKAG